MVKYITFPLIIPFFQNTVKPYQSDLHMTRQVINCQILQIMRQCLYWPEFLQVIFCYCLSC